MPAPQLMIAFASIGRVWPHFAKVVIVACIVVPSRASAQDCPAPLLTVEQDGSVSSGSREMLRAAAESGVPLRIGWSIDGDRDGVPDLLHWTDAVFITVFEGEVFAQIAEIRRQSPRRGEADVELNRTPVRWTGSLGSNGFLMGAFDDDQPPTRVRVRSTWCVDPRVAAENLPPSLREGRGG